MTTPSDRGDPLTLFDVPPPSTRSRLVEPVTAQLPLVHPVAFDRPSVPRPVYRSAPVAVPSPPRAPIVLKVSVSLLGVVFAGAVALLVIDRVSPRVLGFARHFTPIVQPSTPHARPAAAGFEQTSQSATAATYAVGASNFSISVDVSEPVWTVIESPAGKAPPVFASTIHPNQPTVSVPVSRSATVVVSAHTEAITVSSGDRVLGSIHSPGVGVTYSFIGRSG
jgi:hypothetical protein